MVHNLPRAEALGAAALASERRDVAGEPRSTRRLREGGAHGGGIEVLEETLDPAP